MIGDGTAMVVAHGIEVDHFGHEMRPLPVDSDRLKFACSCGLTVVVTGKEIAVWLQRRDRALAMIDGSWPKP